MGEEKLVILLVLRFYHMIGSQNASIGDDVSLLGIEWTLGPIILEHVFMYKQSVNIQLSP